MFPLPISTRPAPLEKEAILSGILHWVEVEESSMPKPDVSVVGKIPIVKSAKEPSYGTLFVILILP